MLALARNKFALVALAALLVTAGLFAHWVWRSRQAEAGLTAIVAALNDAGWRAEIGESSVAGAPNRIDMSIADLKIQSGDGAWRVATPWLETRTTVYRPDYLALFAREPVSLQTPLGALQIAAPEMAASLILEQTRLARLSLDAPAPLIAPETGAPMTLGRAQIHLREDISRDAEYKAYVQIDDAPGGLDLALDGRVRFQAPLRSAPLSAGPPAWIALDPGLTLSWAEASLAITGRLEVEDGGLRGLLGFETDQAAIVIERLTTLGLLTEETARALGDRVSEAGRAAGVLAVEPGAVTIRDLGPVDIPVWKAHSQ